MKIDMFCPRCSKKLTKMVLGMTVRFIITFHFCYAQKILILLRKMNAVQEEPIFPTEDEDDLLYRAQDGKQDH